jgi:hypothetical protein
MFPITTLQKLDMIKQFETRIKTPSKNYCIVTDMSVRFNYHIDNNIRSLVLVDKELSAFLLKHGIISGVNAEGIMFRKAFKEIIYGNRGQFYQAEEKVPVTLDDIKFLPSEVRWFCAYHEYEESISNKVKNRIVYMFQNVLNAA